MMDCQITEVNRETASLYKPLTLGPYQPYLDRIATGEEGVFASGLSLLGVPVGLALACQRLEGYAEIISLFVQEDLRGRGYAGKLLECLETQAKEGGIRLLNLGYSSGNPFAGQIERVLVKSGFSPPAVASVVYRFSFREAKEQDSPWFIKYELPALPEGLIRWQEVTLEERQRLARADWFPQGLSPFIDEHLIEPLNSLAYRDNGEIAAWMITHRLRSDVILYKSLFVREDLRNSGLAALMLIKAIRLQFEQGITDYLLTIYDNNQLILPMVKRWMKAFTVSANEWRQAIKRL